VSDSRDGVDQRLLDSDLRARRGFAVFLVNARDAKHVPGRKTDVSDALGGEEYQHTQGVAIAGDG
jgi:hypothetical protein